MAELKTDVSTQEGLSSSTIESSNTTTTSGGISSGTTTTAEPTTDGGSVTAIGVQGESGASAPLSQNIEVDIVSEGLNDGSVLVYKTASSKWVSTINLNAQNMDAGEF